MRRIARTLALFSVSALLGSGMALAEDSKSIAFDDALDGLVQDDDESDEDDDDLSDILGGDREDTIEQEQDAVRSGDIDDRIGVRSEAVLEAEQEATRRVIKTIQRKNFLKLGRFEATPSFGMVTNDPFLNRYIFGVSLAYHPTEIFAVEAALAFAPDFGEADWKPLTSQLVTKNQVSPDISKLTGMANVTGQFSPFYGKIAFNGRSIIAFNIYGAFGMGITQTQDDLNALQAVGDPIAEATQTQIHPTTNFGGGARVLFNDWLAVRIDARSMIYIETVNSTVLEMKNNFIVSGGASFFFPSMDR